MRSLPAGCASIILDTYLSYIDAIYDLPFFPTTSPEELETYGLGPVDERVPLATVDGLLFMFTNLNLRSAAAPILRAAESNFV
jgi:hypothetical protein